MFHLLLSDNPILLFFPLSLFRHGLRPTETHPRHHATRKTEGKGILFRDLVHCKPDSGDKGNQISTIIYIPTLTLPNSRAFLIIIPKLQYNTVTNIQLKLARRRLVADLYDPVNLEVLELFHDHPLDERLAHHNGQLFALVDQLQTADFFLCASERQRDYWLGMLSALGRINPYTHQDDRLFRNLIATASFGISSRSAEHSGVPAARGVLPGIEEDAKLVVWGGGVYNWFDPLSLLRAWPKVLERVPKARLLFMGMQHPNPDVPAMAMAVEAVRLSAELGLSDKSVHFNMGWVPYDRRQDFLLEADLGVSTHFDHIETAFSFRTRILDYIWAGLPIVATEGDEFAHLIKARDLGRVVGYEDSDGIANAIADLLSDPKQRDACAQAVRDSRADFAWEHTLAPLVRYVADPKRAPDRFNTPEDDRALAREADRTLGSLMAPRGLVPRAMFFVRRDGVGGLAGRIIRTLSRRIVRLLPGEKA